MKINLLTVEGSADLETAIELGLEWGVRVFEIRGIGCQPVQHFSNSQKQRVLELKEERCIKVFTRGWRKFSWET